MKPRTTATKDRSEGAVSALPARAGNVLDRETIEALLRRSVESARELGRDLKRLFTFPLPLVRR